jgi:hypothetical protein
MDLTQITARQLQIASDGVDMNNIEEKLAAIRAQNREYAEFVSELLKHPGNEQQYGRGIGLIMAWLAGQLTNES